MAVLETPSPASRLLQDFITLKNVAWRTASTAAFGLKKDPLQEQFDHEQTR